ncbi:MAG TPA: phosphoribosylanthranilate isomerase [Bacillota bacterium]
MPAPGRPLWIKICGVRDATAALAAQAAGAAAVGFLFAPSPRQTDPETAGRVARLLDPAVARVGVFVDATADAIRAVAQQVGLTHVQLHGPASEPLIRALQGDGLVVIQAFRVRGPEALEAAEASPADWILLDAYVPGVAGGTGQTFDWSLAAVLAAKRPLILAGGLTPGNVGDAIRRVRPFGVDVASGVERRPGEKDPARIASFVRMAQQAWQSIVAKEAAQHREEMARVRRST